MEEKDGMLKKTNEGLKREADALTEKSRGLETALSKSQKEAIFYKQVCKSLLSVVVFVVSLISGQNQVIELSK